MSRIPPDEDEKPLFWVGSSRKDLRSFPEPVQDEIGHALSLAQFGETAECTKPWHGDGPGILEVVESYDGNAFRVVYTVRFAQAVYVLHAFQKKSKKGDKTPMSDRDLVKARLKAAQKDYQTWQAEVAGEKK